MIDQARISLRESYTQDAPEWATAYAQQSQAAALIAIAENLDLLRQVLELMLPGEPIDDSPIDADPVTRSVCLARLDKCECVDKVPRQ